MNQEDFAYIAGVIDNQAIIRMRVYNEAILPFVALHGGNLLLLQRLARLTGTKVTVTKRDYSRVGCMEHCPEQHQHIVSESGRWSLSGAKATVLLAAIRPYLQFQGYAADQAIQAGMEAARKDATVRKMEELGWPIPDEWKLSENS